MTQLYNQDEAVLAAEFLKRNGGEVRQDNGLWVAKQLEFIRIKIYEEPKIANELVTAIPRSNDVPEWAETFTYRVSDEVGIAKVIADYADDLPRVDLTGTPKTISIKALGDSFGYNIQELTVSNALGTDLPSRKGAVARNAIDRKIADLVMVGEAKYGVNGVTNHPNIGSTVLPTLTAWPASTADAIIADMDKAISAVLLQSNGYHNPTHFFMPLTSYNAANTKRNTTTGKSALEMIRESYPGIKFVGVPQLAASKQIIVGEFVGLNIEAIVPQPFKQLPAQARNLEFVIDCIARCAGVAVYMPLAFTKATLV